MTEFPLTQILFWLALFFAPAGTDEIVINSPKGEITLARADNGWSANGATFQLDGDVIAFTQGSRDRRTDVHDYVAKVHGHDWAKEPKLTLSGLTTVEKTAAGLVLRINEGDASEELWRVTYMPGVPQREQGLTISVNVLGHIGRPGTYTLPAGSRLLDAIAAAGGYGQVKAREPRRTVTVLRGEPGRQPSSHPRLENEISAESTITNMSLLDHDTVFVSDPQNDQSSTTNHHPDMTQYILLIHDNAKSDPTPEEWGRFFVAATQTGFFKGGSAIGGRTVIGRATEVASSAHIAGYMRFDAVERQPLLDLLEQHPVVLHGGTTELCELPKT